MSDATLYETIGVTPDASNDQIKKATKKMARDAKDSDMRNSEKNKILRFIKKTREVLLDPSSREEYDKTIGIETVHRSSRNHIVPYQTNPDPVLGAITSVMDDSISHGLMSMMNSMVSDLPTELMPSDRLSSGSFRVTEYTRVSNRNGEVEEFGMTREGDINNERVTEKHFQRRT